MFSGNSILFFILFAAAVAVIIVFSSFFRRRISSAKRKIFYWIAAVVVTVVILIINIGTFGEMLTEQFDNEYIGYILEPPYTLEEMKCLASTGRLSDDDYYRTDDNTDYDYQEETSNQTEEIEDVSPKIYPVTYDITEIDEATDVLTKVSPMNAVASGQLKQHTPQNTMDGDPETNWQVTVEKGTDTDAINEYIGFRFKEKQKIDYIVLTNGTPVPNNLYNKNGRVKSFRFTEKNPKSDETDTDAFESSSFELESDSKKVLFYCEHLEVSELFLMIDKIWPGSKYDEFGIADIQFYEGSRFRSKQDKKAS